MMDEKKNGKNDQKVSANINGNIYHLQQKDIKNIILCA